MSILPVTIREVKPLPETVQHETWCTECTWGSIATAHPSGSPEEIAAGLEASEAVRVHGEQSGHDARSRATIRNTDTTAAEAVGRFLTEPVFYRLVNLLAGVLATDHYVPPTRLGDRPSAVVYTRSDLMLALELAVRKVELEGREFVSGEPS